MTDALGNGQRVTLTGARPARIAKRVEVTAYAARPRWLFVRVRYTQRRRGAARGPGLHQPSLRVRAAADRREPAFWSYQSGSLREAARLGAAAHAPASRSDNFLGMNDTDYGGGTPVVDVWRRDVGLAVGHVELVPKLVSLPVDARRSAAARGRAQCEARTRRSRPATASTRCAAFVAVHRGDSLRDAARLQRGDAGPGRPPAGRARRTPSSRSGAPGATAATFTPEQVFETLPVAKRLGFRWAVLDDGWQVARGRLAPAPATSSRAGDADMKALVDRIHAAGLKAQLWWAPLAADPGSRTDREHPDWLLRNADGSTRKITWWDSHYLCPASDAVREDAAAFVRKALGEWGFDGLKIDGQHLNAAPPCYNPAHAHATPEDGAGGHARASSRRSGTRRRRRSRARSSRSAPAAPATRSSRCPTST